MRSPAAESLAEILLDHLAAIGAGRCSIDDAMIEREPDPERRQILVGLLVLHEDLMLAREEQQEAERRRLEVARERERLVDELRRSVAARDDFLAMASHELRTPLATLKLQLEHLAEALGSPPTEPGAGPGADAGVGTVALRSLPLLLRQTDRLSCLVAEMLDVYRLNSGHLQLHPVPVDLVALIAEVVGRFQPESLRSGSSLTVTAPSRLEGVWDPTRIDQVLRNIVSNALKYGAGRPVEVAVEEPDSGRVRIHVRDQGNGLSAEDQAGLFQPFSRTRATSEHPGLGLGLWIASRLVKASGGQISVASRPGQGATFTVELPRTP